jgi:hypothetical protein
MARFVPDPHVLRLGEALAALARPLPGVRIELQGRDQARVASVVAMVAARRGLS